MLWAWPAQFRAPVLGVHSCAAHAGLRAGALLGAGAAVVTVLGWRWAYAVRWPIWGAAWGGQERPGGVLWLGVGALAYGPGGLHTRGSWLELGRRLAGRLRIPTQLGGDGHLGGRGGASPPHQPVVEYRTPRALSPLICDLWTVGRLADRCENT